MADEAVSGKGGASMTHYRIFISNSGLYANSANYPFVAEFADQKRADFYIQYMRNNRATQTSRLMMSFGIPITYEDSSNGRQ